MHRWRERVRARPGANAAWRVFVAVLGIAIVALGLVLVPAPGPGWLIVIAGLAVLASEFAWAHRLLHFTRSKVQAWTRWVLARSRPVRAAIGLVSLVFVAAVLYTSLRFGMGVDLRDHVPGLSS